jgi:tetratricopeptide (TPR) repeat protein
MTERTVYEFGAFRFDAEQCLLMRLDHKSLRILKQKKEKIEGELGKSRCPLLLAFLKAVSENEGHEILLPEDVLITAGWPEPNKDKEIAKSTLKRTINNLKTILKNNDPKEFDYIERVGNSYRFRVPVTRLSASEIERPRGTVVSDEAQASFGWGRHHLDTFTTEDGLHKAIEEFQKAYAIAPDYAAAYAHEALAHLWLSIFSWTAPRNTLPQALLASAQALSCGKTLGVAHAARALSVLFSESDGTKGWKEAELLRETALTLDQKCDQKFEAVYQVDALMQTAGGQFGKADLTIKRSLKINPVSFISNVLMAMNLFASRDYRSCDDFLQELKAKESDIDALYYIRVLVCIYKGEPDKALEEIEQGERMAEGNILYRLLLAYWEAIWGSKHEAINLLNKLDAEAETDRRYISPYHRALPYVHIDGDKAIEGLERSASEKDPWVFLLNVDPRVDLLRRNERFIALLHRLGFS